LLEYDEDLFVTMDEKELIQKCLQGDDSAFETLVQQNKMAVFHHCLKIVRDEEIAQDLMQEAFVHAYQHLESFRMEARFSTWLWRIAHNLSLNYLRKKHAFEQEYKEEILHPKLFVKEEVDEEFLLKIQQALAILPEKQRIVFEMYDLQHIPQKEIAAQLGISPGTVRSRLHYARQRLKKFLQEASGRIQNVKGKSDLF
jgi:RNA polymerase sigma-70 factor (ECF subfamily)